MATPSFAQRRATNEAFARRIALPWSPWQRITVSVISGVWFFCAATYKVMAAPWTTLVALVVLAIAAGGMMWMHRGVRYAPNRPDIGAGGNRRRALFIAPIIFAPTVANTLLSWSFPGHMIVVLIAAIALGLCVNSYTEAITAVQAAPKPRTPITPTRHDEVFGDPLQETIAAVFEMIGAVEYQREVRLSILAEKLGERPQAVREVLQSWKRTGIAGYHREIGTTKAKTKYFYYLTDAGLKAWREHAAALST